MDENESEEKLQSLKPDELVKAVEPHARHLEKYGEMRDNDTINDKQLKAAQSPVAAAANAIVKLKLARDYYRAKWRYKDGYKADKWAHKDKVRKMRKERREAVQAAKQANTEARLAARERKAEARKQRKEDRRAERAAAKELKRNGKTESTSLSQKNERSE